MKFFDAAIGKCFFIKNLEESSQEGCMTIEHITIKEGIHFHVNAKTGIRSL
jgi:hypothetical protein